MSKFGLKLIFLFLITLLKLILIAIKAEILENLIFFNIKISNMAILFKF